METNLQHWTKNTQVILRNKPWVLKFTKIFQEIVRFIKVNDWQGACHAVSSVFYVLLAEQGITSNLCIGEVQIGKLVFNHSWIEIDEEVYDVAIISTLYEEFHFPPTVRGFNVETKKPTDLRYGVFTGLPDDPPTHLIKATTFASFMEDFPHHRDGLWGITVVIGKKIGANLDVRTIRSIYASTTWNIY